MDSVEVIPSSIDVGKAEMVVVIFPCDIPQDKLITLELKYNKSSRKSSWSTWVPGQPLGLKCLRAQLPAIPHPGEVEVSVKVSRVAFSLCPKFQLHIHSPVETIFHSVVASRQGSTGTALACIAAYLLHTHEKDLTTIAHNDTTVCRALQSQPSHVSEWNLSSLIFGKYGSNESLLHLFVRCKLDGAASLLLEKSKGKNTILQQQDYRGRTPAEIARKKGSKRIAEMVDEAITKTARSTNYEYRDPTGKLKKSKSLEQEQLHGIFSSEEDIGPLPIQLPTKQTGVWQKFKKQSKLSNDKKGSSPASQPSTPTHSEDIHPEAPSNALPLPPRSPWPSPVSQDSSSGGQRPQSTAEPLQQLLSRCLYQASVLREYSWENSPFGDKVSLKRGDIVYVIKDLGNDFCQGVCNNFYCTVPKYILANDDADDDYEHMSPVDSSDYEEIDEEYDIPGPAGVQPTPSPLQPAPLDTQAESITERQFKVPPMRPAIKTQAFKPAVPGRLLPDCTHSSSHDTGLDRLGLPRQVSRSKMPNQQLPFSNQSKRAVGPDSSQLETEAPNEFRSNLKPVKHRPTSQKEPVASPPSESEDEYDDASSLQQYQEQQQQRPPKPPVKTPVSRAVSLGGQPSRIRPAIKPRIRSSSSEDSKPRTQSSSSDNPKTKPPSPLPRVKRTRPVKVADGSASPSVSDRRKMFEGN